MKFIVIVSENERTGDEKTLSYTGPSFMVAKECQLLLERTEVKTTTLIITKKSTTKHIKRL